MQNLLTSEVDTGVFRFLLGMKATEYGGEAIQAARGVHYGYIGGQELDNFLHIDFLRMYIFRAYRYSYVGQEMRFIFLIRSVRGPVPELVAM